MPLIELSDYRLKNSETALPPFFFAAAEDDFWLLESDRPEMTKLFFRALATLIAPVRGKYRFSGSRLDFTDYNRMLECKKKISFISPDIALVSNRTIRENLLLTHYYEANALSLPLTASMEKMCRQLGLTDKLDFRVTEISQWDLWTGLIIRELAKPAALLLIDRPETLVPPEKQHILTGLLQNQQRTGKAIICHSRDKKYIDNFSPTGKILISRDSVCITPRY